MSDTVAQSRNTHSQWRLVIISAMMLGVFGMALIAFRGDRPASLTHIFQDATASISVSPAAVRLPGDALTVAWDVINTREVYVNDEGRIGQDRDRLTIDQCSAPWTLRMIAQDGSEELVTVDPGVWTLDAANIALLLLSLVPAALWLRPGLTASAWPWRAGAVSSLMVLLWYAWVPFCDGQTLWTFAGLYPVAGGLYGAAIVSSSAALILSLVRPAKLVQLSTRLFQLPQWLFLAAVIGLMAAWGSLLAIWGYRLPIMTVLPPVTLLASWLVMALYHNHQACSNQASPMIQRSTLHIAGLIALLSLWLLPWQTLVSDPWLSTGLGLLAFIIPGALIVQLVYRSQQQRLSRSLSLGFIVSAGITSIIGWVATTLEWSPDVVWGSLIVIGLLALLLDYRQTPAPTQPSPAPTEMGNRFSTMLLALIGIVMAVLLSRGILAFTIYYGNSLDYLTYNVQVTHFAQSEVLSLKDPFLGTGLPIAVRFWVSYFPLTQAVISNLSGVHPLVLQQTLGVWIGLLSFVTVYSLARAFSLSRSLGWFAVIAQAFAYSQLLSTDEAGFIFMQRILQDKAILAFVIAPVMVELLINLQRSRQWPQMALFIVGGLLMTFTHPTMLFLTALILGLMALQDMLFERRWTINIMVIVILGLCMIPPAGIRFLTNFAPSAFSAAIIEQMPERHTNRLFAIEGTPFISLQSYLVDGLPFFVLFAVMLVALFYIRKQQPARYILATGFLLLSVIIPYTGWIIGLGITIGQMWRVPWLMPFGLAAAWLIHMAARRWSADRLMARVMPALSILMLVWTVITLGQQNWLARDLERLSEGQSSLSTYGALLDVADFISEDHEGPALVLGDTHTTSLIPSLSAQISTMAFRGTDMYLHVAGMYGVDPDRYNNYLGFFQTEDDNERIAILEEYSVDYVLIRGGNSATDDLPELFPEQFSEVYRSGSFILYQVSG